MTSIGGDWISQIDPSSGYPYYTNTVTGEVTWTYPTDIPSVNSSTTNEEWIETYDEGSGAYYYLNSVTGASTWDKPANYKPHPNNSSSVNTNTNTTTTGGNNDPESIPSNWTSGVDGGYTYYVNSVTGKTQWDKPACLVDETKPTPSESSPPNPPTPTPASPPQSSSSSVPLPPPVVKRASVLPPPSISTTSSPPPPVAAAEPPIPPVAKKASVLPPPSLAKPPPTIPKPAENPPTPTPPIQNLSISEPPKIDPVPTPVPPVAIPAKPETTPPVPPVASQTTTTTTTTTPTTTLSVENPSTESSEGSSSSPPKAVAKKSKQASFAALRAMETNDEEEKEVDAKKRGKQSSFAALRSLETNEEDSPVRDELPSRITEEDNLPNDSMAAANEYVANSTSSYPVAVRTIQRILARDDKTTAELVDQVQGITLEQYGEKFFNFDRKGIFKSRTTIEKLLSWKNEVIKTSLRVLSPELSQEAVQIFRNVTGFMGDRSTNKANIDHALKVLNHMMLAPEELRDELFCQICKQTNHNPDALSTEKGWQMLMMSLAIFPPSSDLMPHLMAYCAANLRNENPNVAIFAEICLHRIPKITRLGPRRELPTKIELEALKRGGSVNVRIFFLDGKYCNMRADSWTTSKELEDDIAKLLGIANSKPFSLFEVSSGEEERVLDPDERILDLVSFWQRTELEEITKVGKSGEIEEFRFMYKVGLFYEVEDSDTSAIELLYVQATHDIVDSRYPCSEQDAVTLAALQMQEAFGDFPASGTCTYLRGKLGVYLSARLIEQHTPAELEEQIYKLYKKLTGYSQMEARLSYLDYVKSWKIYGSTFFFAEPQNNKDLPRECVLAVNNKGILVVDPTTKEFLAEYEYSTVVTWGHSLNSFVIVTGSTNRQIKMYFKTDQGKEINNMVRCYVENRMG